MYKAMQDMIAIGRDNIFSAPGVPRVFKNKVLIGHGGGDWGNRGYVTAYDIETGKQAWRF